MALCPDLLIDKPHPCQRPRAPEDPNLNKEPPNSTTDTRQCRGRPRYQPPLPPYDASHRTKPASTFVHVLIPTHMHIAYKEQRTALAYLQAQKFQKSSIGHKSRTYIPINKDKSAPKQHLSSHSRSKISQDPVICKQSNRKKSK